MRRRTFYRITIDNRRYTIIISRRADGTYKTNMSFRAIKGKATK